MAKFKYITLSTFVFFFISCTVKPIEGNIHSRVTEINFECNVLDGANDEKILQPYEIFFHLLIENLSTDTLYFCSANVTNSCIREYGYFILASPSDTIEFTTTDDYSYAIPPNMCLRVSGWHLGYEALKTFTASTKTTEDEVYEKINKYKLLFIPHLESFPANERKKLAFPSEHTFDLDSVTVSYLSEGKGYLDLFFDNVQDNLLEP